MDLRDLSSHILIKGTVYALSAPTPHCENFSYLRISVPPDAVPGRRSSARMRYLASSLPPYEVITPERAKEIQAESLARWTDALREAAQP